MLKTPLLRGENGGTSVFMPRGVCGVLSISLSRFSSLCLSNTPLIAPLNAPQSVPSREGRYLLVCNLFNSYFCIQNYNCEPFEMRYLRFLMADIQFYS